MNFPFFIDYKTDFEKKICNHLEEYNENHSYYKYFTGNDFEFYIVCYDCSREPLEKIRLVTISEETFETIYEESINESVGKPTYHQTPSNEVITKTRNVFIPEFSDKEIISFTQTEKSESGVLFCLTNHLLFYKVNLTYSEIIKQYKLPNYRKVDPNNSVITIISPNENFLVLANTNGRYGVVYDLNKEEIKYEFDRKDYHYDVSVFP